MIEEAYVGFETAKLLKEKGFDERCTHYYKNEKYLVDLAYANIRSYTNSDLVEEFAAPTNQMAMAWLREKGIAVVPIVSSVLDNKSFLWDIEITVAKTNETYRQGWVYEKQENAIEEALKYSLKNLIEK